MKKICVVLVLLVVALAPVCAAEQSIGEMLAGGAPGPWDTGIFAGMITDLVGYALFVAGGAVTGIDLGVGIALFDIGSLGMTAGGIVWNTFLDQKNAAYAKEGIAIPADKRGLSWTLVWVSAGCSAGSIVVSLIDSNFTTAIISLLLAGGAAIAETINALGPRTEWTAKLNEGYKARHASAPEPQLVPVVTVQWNRETNSREAYVGVKLAM
jgi:hypothetical protein